MPNLPIKPPPKVDSKLKPVSLRTVKTTALATAPPVKGWRFTEGTVDSPETAAAYHEAGHAVATVLAFRDAAWLPHPMPPLLVRHVEITEDTGNGAATAPR